jgi:hypothetical protein
MRVCIVSCCDLKGVEHSLEVTAASLYEAVAQGLRRFAKTIGSTSWEVDALRSPITGATPFPAFAPRSKTLIPMKWLYD